MRTLLVAFASSHSKPFSIVSGEQASADHCRANLGGYWQIPFSIGLNCSSERDAPTENGGWFMPLPRCPYCRQIFAPSHYHPDQAVCCAPDCQRLRRAAYHRAKLHNDPLYRAQCRDSQKQWREQHPDYMRAYRKSQRARRPAVPPDQEQRSDLVSLLERVKNNVAIDLSACAATILFVGRKQRVKNILASVQLILIEELPNTASSTPAL